MKTNDDKNGMTIAYSIVPVMYRLLEDSGQPARQQTLGKSSRQGSGRPAGRACAGAVDTTTAVNCWEASDQRRKRNATP